MVDQDSNKFHFLPTVTSSTRTDRDIALLRSSARSHLAKTILHRERRLKASQLTAKPKLTSFASNGTSVLQASAADYIVVSSGVYALRHQKQYAEFSSEDAAVRNVHLAEADALRADLRYIESLLHVQEEQSITMSVTQSSSMPALSVYRPNAWTTVSHHLSSLHSLRLFEYCGTTLWKGYEPGMDIRNPYDPLQAIAWAASDVGNCSYFNGSMWQAAIHLSVREGKLVTSVESLQYYQRALRMMAKDLTKPVDDIDQTTIFTMFGLCVPEPKRFEIENHSSDGFQSPFLELQWIGLLGREPLVENHLNAVFRIVELKGGIDMLHLFSISYGVQYLDVVHSTFNLSPPRYAVARIFQHDETSNSRENLFGLKKFLSTEGPLDRFREIGTLPLQQLVWYGLAKEVFEVALDLRVWSRLLRLRHEMNVKVGGSLIALRRNIIQHKLLQTIKAGRECIGDTDTSRTLNKSSQTSLAITDLVRTGLLVFSVGVTFPVRYAPLYDTLTSKLQRLLRKHISMLLENGLYEVLIWLCMLGCLATTRATDSDSLDWFIDTICQVENLRARMCASQRAGRNQQDHFIQSEDTSHSLDWDRVKESCLTPFVWNDDACDSGARFVWLLVQMQLADVEFSN